MCFGVLYYTNMYPEHTDMWPGGGYKVEHLRLWKIISLPYWQIFGELSLNQLTGKLQYFYNPDFFVVIREITRKQ